MPYTIKSKNLPSYVKKLSTSLKTKWIAIFNSVYSEEGEKMAIVVANAWLKRQVNKPKLVAKSKQFRTLTFELDNKGDFIKKDSEGNNYISFMLTDTLPDSHGESYTPELLQQWADEINSGSMIVGDCNHEEFDKILANHADPEVINQKLKEKTGIAKAVKAIYEKGKLWVKALIDKRYKKVLEKTRGVSLEAFIEDAQDNIAQTGRLLGFTFMINQDQANPRAVIS